MLDSRARMLGILGMMLLLVSGAGCMSHQSPSQATVPQNAELGNDDSYVTMKDAYLKANPAARVGKVVAVLPAQQRIAVGDIPVSDFRKGDVVSVVDSQLRPLADGTVLNADAELLYVTYMPLTVGSPAPVVGDIVIRAYVPDRSEQK